MREILRGGPHLSDFLRKAPFANNPGSTHEDVNQLVLQTKRLAQLIRTACVSPALPSKPGVAAQTSLSSGNRLNNFPFGLSEISPSTSDLQKPVLPDIFLQFIIYRFPH